MPKLVAHVHTVSPAGEVVVLKPDDELPEWAVSAVRNPKAWEGGAAPELPEAQPAGVPPKTGAGSGVDAWKAYAASKGVDVAALDKREDIVAALEKAGIPTE